MTYKPEEIIPNCPNCEAPMVLKTKGTDKFWGCPHWKERGCKTLAYGKTPQKDKPQVIRPEQPDPMLMIFDELRAIHKRMDSLATYLAENLK